MRAIILAAGRGSRLGPLTSEIPKCMVELGGRPLLEWQASALKEAGADEIALVTGYQAGKLPAAGYSRFHNERWQQTNMVMSLACASPWLEREACIVSYSDIVYSPSAVACLARTPGDIAIAYDPRWLDLWSLRFEDPLSDAETFRMDGEGRLLEIGLKPRKAEDVQGQYMGLLRFTPRGWAIARSRLDRFASAERDRLDMTSLLRNLLLDGNEIRTVPIDSRWYEVDNESDLRLYQDMFDRGEFLKPRSPGAGGPRP
jgi:choline kinase